jgi:hypothetical protein
VQTEQTPRTPTVKEKNLQKEFEKISNMYYGKDSNNWTIQVEEKGYLQ